MKNISPKKITVIIIFSMSLFLNTGFVNKAGIVNTTDAIVKVEQENDALTVSVKTSKNITIRFYMFNVEGRLTKELSIYGSKKIVITALEKGIYSYDFFTNDERIKNGKIELK